MKLDSRPPVASLHAIAKSLEHSPDGGDPSSSMTHYDTATMATCIQGQQQPQQQHGGYTCISPTIQQQQQPYTPISQQSAGAVAMDYNSPSTCNMYEYQMKSQVHDSMISPPQPPGSGGHTVAAQQSPGSYYSPVTLHQVPVEGTITATNCNYNTYYPYGMTGSPSHNQSSPLSSHHSSSPLMQHSPPQIHPSSAAMQTTLM